MAVDGSGNVFIIFFNPQKGTINLTESTNNGTSFGTPVSLGSSLSSLPLPLIIARGSNIFVSYNTFSISGGQTFPQQLGVFSSDDGATWSSPMVLHSSNGGISSEIQSLFFEGLSDPTAVEVGANLPGSSTGALAFADFGDASGASGFTTDTLASGFSQASGYSHSDGSLEVGAINSSDNSTHLLQGTLPTTGFSALAASTDKALQVSISGDDTNAFIVQTINAVPGPVEMIGCQ